MSKLHLIFISSFLALNVYLFFLISLIILLGNPCTQYKIQKVERSIIWDKPYSYLCFSISLSKGEFLMYLSMCVCVLCNFFKVLCVLHIVFFFFPLHFTVNLGDCSLSDQRAASFFGVTEGDLRKHLL